MEEDSDVGMFPIMTNAENIDSHFKDMLKILKWEKVQEKNKEHAREIAIVITELEKSYSYFQIYVKEFLK